MSTPPTLLRSFEVWPSFTFHCVDEANEDRSILISNKIDR